ncbi:MAG: hypothetical protein A2297_07600 [Elusimicrobia bacterium RIFOXYB2_FULL_48_7]|nr:MAG: hypothetical protein A2297_07600 [Elusimicrobia bacterium RIFOXYB2_FULL_48_7]
MNKIIFFSTLILSIVISIGPLHAAPPVAEAGPDISVEIGSAVNLDGSLSHAVTGNIISYQWNQIEGAGWPVVIPSSSSVQCSFTPNRMDIFCFQLTIKDSNSEISRDTVTVTINYPSNNSYNGVFSYPLATGCTWYYDVKQTIAGTTAIGSLVEEIIGITAIEGKSCFEMHSYGEMTIPQNNDHWDGEIYKCLGIENACLYQYAFHDMKSPGAGMEIFSLKKNEVPAGNYYIFNNKKFYTIQELLKYFQGLMDANTFSSATRLVQRGIFGGVTQSSYTIYDPPRSLLRLPTTLGLQWTRFSVGEIGTVNSRVNAYRRVTVPAGVFDCVEIVSDWFFESKIIEWYSDYGLIKRYIYSGPIITMDQTGNPVGSFAALFDYELKKCHIPPDTPITKGPQATSLMPLAYPNPFRLSENSKIFFKNISSGAEIKILTLSGKLIRTIRSKDSYGLVYWDGRNESNELVRRGIYLYVTTNTQGEKKTGKITVTR